MKTTFAFVLLSCAFVCAQTHTQVTIEDNQTITSSKAWNNAGTFTGAQCNFYLSSQVAGTDPCTWFFTTQGGYSTDAGTFIQAVPVGGTKHQYNGINSAITTSAVSSPLGTNENSVAGYFSARNLANTTAAWAINGTCGSNGNITGHVIICDEMDIGMQTGDIPTRFQGYFLTSGPLTGTMPSGPVMGTLNVASNSASAFGVAINTSSTAQFPVAFWSSKGSATMGVILDASCYSGSCNSQGIQMGGNDGSNAHTVGLVASSVGDLVVTPDTGRGMRIATATFSQLPSCTSGIEGSMRPLTDANTAVWGANITAGSSTNHVLAYCDGTNWTVMGK